MILRSLGLRHGRRFLSSPAPRLCLRTLSTETTTAPPPSLATREPASASSGQGPAPQAFHNPEIPSQQPDTTVEDFRTFNTLQNQTKKLGSRVELRYTPDEILKNPPHDASLELLMAAQAHMGHNTSLWNPHNSRYIYGERAGIHIISLEETAAHLRRAARVVEDISYNGGLVLFVGNRPGHMPIVVRAAELAGACHLFDKWAPGTLTNRDQVLSSAPLKVVDEHDRDVEGFDKFLQDCRPVLPDLIVCLNPLENYLMLHECGLANVPTIGVIDTDADPSWVTYAIPANDDSLRTAALIAGVLGRGGQRGQQRRLKDAEEGIVTWQNPTDIRRHVKKETAKELEAHKKVMRAAQARGGGEEQEEQEALAAQLKAFSHFQKQRDNAGHNQGSR